MFVTKTIGASADAQVMRPRNMRCLNGFIRIESQVEADGVADDTFDFGASRGFRSLRQAALILQCNETSLANDARVWAECSTCIPKIAGIAFDQVSGFKDVSSREYWRFFGG